MDDLRDRLITDVKAEVMDEIAESTTPNLYAEVWCAVLKPVGNAVSADVNQPMTDQLGAEIARRLRQGEGLE